MITKAQIRSILDANLPGPYVHFQKRDLIAQLIIDLIKDDKSEPAKVAEKKKVEIYTDKSE